jgi:hypothetical protein
VFGVVTADAHHLAQREVNARAVYVLVLVTHGRLPGTAFYSGAKILPGFMMPFGSNTALIAFMQAISTGERL